MLPIIGTGFPGLAPLALLLSLITPSCGGKLDKVRPDTKEAPTLLGSASGVPPDRLTEADFAEAARRAALPDNEYADAETGLRLDLLEGDIVDLAASLATELQATAEDTTTSGRPLLRNAIRDPDYLWPNGRVAYSLDASFNTADSRAVLASAILELEQQTCIRFSPTTIEDHDYVTIAADNGCYSYVGRVGGAQQLSLGYGCVRKGIVLHELMHAIGFVHEQSRSDRDQYIQVNWDNVRAGYEDQFKSYGQAYIDHLGVAYDYGSVMHYGPYAFSGNGSPTISVRQAGQSIGQRRGLSHSDARKINLLYGCKTAVTVTQPTAAPAVVPCANKRSDCDAIASAGYCQFDSWSRANCPLACGVCQMLSTTAAATTDRQTGVGCSDLALSCALYKQQGWCERYHNWSRVNCHATCGFCGSVSLTTNKPPSPQCYDTRSDCLSLQSWGYCQVHPDWMRANCGATCASC